MPHALGMDILPDGSPQVNALIYGLVCLSVGQRERIDTLLMLSLYMWFSDHGKPYLAGVACQLADESVGVH